MRKYLLVLAAVLILPAAGCDDTSDSAGALPTTGSPAASAAVSTPASTPVSQAPEKSGAVMPPATSPADHPPKTSSSPAPTGSRGDPDMPRDQVGAPVVLTGTVETGGPCVILTAKGHRWGLVGSAARKLADGQTVTVRGRPVPLPRGCDADFALAIRA